MRMVHGRRSCFNRANFLLLCAFGVPVVHIFTFNSMYSPLLSTMEAEERAFISRIRSRIRGIDAAAGNLSNTNPSVNIFLPLAQVNPTKVELHSPTALVKAIDLETIPTALLTAPVVTLSNVSVHIGSSQLQTDFGALNSSKELCWNHFDFGMLELWDQKQEMFCTSPNSVLFLGEPEPDLTERNDTRINYTLSLQRPGWLRCRVHVDDHLSKASSPHTMCDAANVLLDVSQATPTGCLKSRENYQCDGPPIWYQWAPGAFTAKCIRQPSLKLDRFPKDHLKDLFTSFQGNRSKKNASFSIFEHAPVTLVVTRERGEHANMFHSTADFINMFFTLHVSGVISGLDGNRTGMERVQVLILDDQVGPFETLIKDVFSPSYPLLRITSLQSAGTRYLNMRHALFAPPGYSSIMLACNESRPYCPHGSGLLQSFRRFVLEGLGLPHAVPAEQRRTPADTIRVTFLSRRAYNCDNVEHQFMLRQIANEDQFMAALRAEPGVNVTRYDFACRSPRFQLEVMGRTDVLVAMHGAGMTNEIYLHRTAVIVELWPKLHGFKLWKCFKHIAHLMGLGYFRWINLNMTNYRSDELGDYTTVNMTLFVPTYRQALAAYRDGLMR